MLVLGATGVSGRIAVALAARMATGRVISAGRNRAILDRLPAAAGPGGIHVIIDYLWGPPTEAAIAAVTRRGLAHAAPRVHLVEVGRMAHQQEITEKADIGFGFFYNHFDSRAIVQFGGHLIKVTLRDRLEVGAAGHTGIIRTLGRRGSILRLSGADWLCRGNHGVFLVRRHVRPSCPRLIRLFLVPRASAPAEPASWE